jgi:hypothetical protein
VAKPTDSYKVEAMGNTRQEQERALCSVCVQQRKQLHFDMPTLQPKISSLAPCVGSLPVCVS